MFVDSKANVCGYFIDCQPCLTSFTLAMMIEIFNVFSLSSNIFGAF
jgi:hypothetical protein